MDRVRRAARPLLALLLPLLAAPAAAAGLPQVVSNAKPNLKVRPATISYTGDGTGLVGGSTGTSVRHPGRLPWSIYNHTRGVARGLVWLDDCDPDCAEGTFTASPVRVTVSRPRSGVFRKLTLSFRYRGKHVVDKRRAVYLPPQAGAGGFWDYQIISQRGF